MWNSVNGYVIIRLDGYSLEKLLNRMLQQGIPIWNVRYEGTNAAVAEIRAGDFKKLIKIKRGLKCTVRVVSRRGTPFVFARMKRRKTLIIGLVLGIILLYAGQTRLWFIQIDGLYQLPKGIITKALDEQGIKPGMARKDIVPLSLSESIRAYDERIAYAGVSLQGVALMVNIVEAQINEEPQDKTKPADIIAAKDGVIEKIEAFRGKANVKAGDAVRKGDILIRGDITREGASKSLVVYSEGIVSAKVYYESAVTLPLTQRALKRNGNEMPYRALYIGSFPVYIKGTKYKEYEKTLDKTAQVKGLVLPLKYETGYYHELSYQDVLTDKEELYAQTLFYAELEALMKVPKDSKILDKKSAAQWNNDGSLTITVSIVALEEIGETIIIAGY